MSLWIISAGGAVVTLLLAYMQGCMAGAKRERAKWDAERIKGLESRLEMDREADASELEVRRLNDDEARREAMKWAR